MNAPAPNGDQAALIAAAIGAVERLDGGVDLSRPDQLERGLAEAFATSVALHQMASEGPVPSRDVMRAAEGALRVSSRTLAGLQQAESDVVQLLAAGADPQRVDAERMARIRRLHRLAGRAVIGLHRAIAIGYERMVAAMET